MRAPRSPSVSRPGAPHRKDAGFSFVELIVVMGIMAVLMGLAAGFFANAGRAGKVAIARRTLEDLARRVQNDSLGAKTGFLTLRKGQDDEEGQVVVEAGISRTVFTAQFETLERGSEGRIMQPVGNVVHRPHQGHSGAGAFFDGGGLRVGTESVFAMTDGVEIEAWLQPSGGARQLTILRGQDGQGEMVYELSLVQEGNSSAYRVRMAVSLSDRNLTDTSSALPWVRETEKAPVLANGKTWTHVLGRWDTSGVEILVSGRTMALRDDGRSKSTRPEDEAARSTRRIRSTGSGVVTLFVSSEARGFRGMMDAVRLRGVFRSAANRFVMADGLHVVSPRLPLRIEYANGRLAGTGGSDVELWIRDQAHMEDLPLRFVFGAQGTLSFAYVNRAPPTLDPDAGRQPGPQVPGGAGEGGS